MTFFTTQSPQNVTLKSLVIMKNLLNGLTQKQSRSLLKYSVSIALSIISVSCIAYIVSLSSTISFQSLLRLFSTQFSVEILTPLGTIIVFGFFKISGKEDRDSVSPFSFENTRTGFIDPEDALLNDELSLHKTLPYWNAADGSVMILTDNLSTELKTLKKEVERIESEILKRKNFMLNGNILPQRTDYEAIVHLMNTVCHEAAFLGSKWYSEAKRVIHSCYNNLLFIQSTLAKLDEVQRKYPHCERFVSLYSRYLNNLVAPYLNSYIKALDSRDPNDLNYVVFGFAIVHQHTSYTMPSFSDFFDAIMMIRSQFPEEFNNVSTYKMR